MSEYDFSMVPESEVTQLSRHGWSGPPKKDKIKGKRGNSVYFNLHYKKQLINICKFSNKV